MYVYICIYIYITHMQSYTHHYTSIVPRGSTGFPLLHTLLPGELSVAPGAGCDGTPEDGIEIHKIP